MGPTAHVDHRCGNRWLSRRRCALPAASTHPVVDEVPGRGVSGRRFPGPRRQRLPRCDAVGLVRCRTLRLDEREQRRFVQRHGAHSGRVGQGRYQSHCSTIGMSHQRQRGAARARTGSISATSSLMAMTRSECHSGLLPEPRNRRQHVEIGARRFHQPAPLRRAAGVRVQAHDPGAGTASRQKGSGTDISVSWGCNAAYRREDKAYKLPA